MFRRLFCVLVLAFSLCVLPVSAYEDIAPTDAPFVGSAYVTADTNSLGVVSIYFPVSFLSGYWGVDQHGSLFNVSNTSISGVLYTAAGREYQFRCQSWSTPQYRDPDGNYTYYDLEITDVLTSNVQIAESFPPLVSTSTIFPYAYLMIGGVICLCLFLKRF